MTDLTPLVLAAVVVLAVVVVIRLRARRKIRTSDLLNVNSNIGGSRGRPGADKH